MNYGSGTVLSEVQNCPPAFTGINKRFLREKLINP